MKLRGGLPPRGRDKGREGGDETERNQRNEKRRRWRWRRTGRWIAVDDDNVRP